MANYNDYLEYLKHIDNTTEQEIKSKINGLNDEISNLKTSLSNLNKVKDDLTTDLANAKKQINEKTDLINLKETELKKVSNDLANVQKDLKETNFKLTELEKLHNIEQKKNATISNELAEVKSKYYILESEVKNKSKKVNDYIAEIQKLHLDLENAKNDFKNASASNTSTTEQINKYRSEISNLNKTIDDLKKKNNSAELTDLKVKLDKTEWELNELAKNKKLLDNELKTEKERNKNLNESLIKKNEGLKNFEPKNNLKFILGSLAVIFLITTIIFYSKYDKEISKLNYAKKQIDYFSGLRFKVGKPDLLGTYRFNKSTNWPMSFTVKKKIILDSITVFADKSGLCDIYIKNETNEKPLYQKTFSLNEGKNELFINEVIELGNYKMGYNNDDNIVLAENSDTPGVEYDYGFIIINDKGMLLLRIYPHFYNWRIRLAY